MSSLNSILHRNKLFETGCRLFRFESLTSLSTKPTRRRQQWQVEANTLVLHFSHLDLDIESSEYNIGTFTQVLIFIRYFCSGISTCFVVLPLINAMSGVNLRCCHCWRLFFQNKSLRLWCKNFARNPNKKSFERVCRLGLNCLVFHSGNGLDVVAACSNTSNVEYKMSTNRLFFVAPRSKI